jgi:hypothetical protein
LEVFPLPVFNTFSMALFNNCFVLHKTTEVVTSSYEFYAAPSTALEDTSSKD